MRKVRFSPLRAAKRDVFAARGTAKVTCTPPRGERDVSLRDVMCFAPFRAKRGQGDA